MTDLTGYAEEEVKGIEQSVLSIEQMEEMKKTEGWKTIQTKIKQELLSRITELVQGDAKVTTLLSILHTVETKSSTSLLEEQINQLFPE